jgi:GPH family glycoside/pentoside/hexuronide:cation symporter
MAIFSILGLLIAFLGSGFLIDHFDFRVMTIVTGAIAFISLCVPVIFIRETPWSRAKQVTLSFIGAIKQCFRNKPFLYYVSAFFPIINYLAKRLGKKTIYAASLLLFSILTSMLGTIGVFPFPPFYYGLFLIALAGIPVSGFMVGSNAIIADVIDHDETITGFRREAMYFGVQGLLLKLGIGVSALIFTVLLHLFGKTPAEPLGVTLAGPVAGIIVFIGFVVFRKYPFQK